MSWHETPVVCAWCGLVKETNDAGEKLWPEPWLPKRRFTKRGERTWDTASHGMCPECFQKVTHKEVA